MLDAAGARQATAVGGQLSRPGVDDLGRQLVIQLHAVEPQVLGGRDAYRQLVARVPGFCLLSTLSMRLPSTWKLSPLICTSYVTGGPERSICAPAGDVRAHRIPAEIQPASHRNMKQPSPYSTYHHSFYPTKSGEERQTSGQWPVVSGQCGQSGARPRAVRIGR